MTLTWLCRIGLHKWERVATWSRQFVCTRCRKTKLEPMDDITVNPIGRIFMR